MREREPHLTIKPTKLPSRAAALPRETKRSLSPAPPRLFNYRVELIKVITCVKPPDCVNSEKPA